MDKWQEEKYQKEPCWSVRTKVQNNLSCTKYISKIAVYKVYWGLS